jgi:hypothetical protein
MLLWRKLNLPRQNNNLAMMRAQALFNPLLYKGANISMAEELSFIAWAGPTE